MKIDTEVADFVDSGNAIDSRLIKGRTYATEMDREKR